MRPFNATAGSLAVAILAICAVLVTHAPFVPWPTAAQAQSAKQVEKQPKKRAPAKPAQPKAGSAAAIKTRAPFTAEDAEKAVVLGLPDARAWGDSEDEFARLLPTASGPWLAMSGGGSDGAYAAGLLTGLSQSGKRPQFAVVSGASIGALIAPFAFLGPSRDEELHALFTTITAADIFEDRPTPTSLMDSWPLKRTIEQHATPQLLADIAAEHRRGRRLFVVTTNLDTGRRVVWNMGAIAERGDDKALQLFRDVLLASASIPGLFPPVTVEAQANGKEIQELHNDGTITAPFFIAPEAVLAGTGTVHLPTREIYVIANAKLQPSFELTAPQTTAVVLGRSIAVALRNALRVELLLTLAAAQKQGIALSVAQIDPEFEHPSRGAFDPDYMQALYQFGLDQAKAGKAFETVAADAPELRSGISR
jgi:Patatin-like phospholipase